MKNPLRKSDKNTKLQLSLAFLAISLALAGCSSFLESSSPTPSQNVTSTPTDEFQTDTQTATPISTPTPTATPELTKKDKYGSFRDGYVEGLENNDVMVKNHTLDAQNDTLYIAYQMRDPESDLYTGRERENITLGYVVGVEHYIDENQTDVDRTWVPKQVNVTAYTSDGELYETAYTTFKRAKKMIDGEISAKRYLLEYYATTEPGPANPEYEE